MLLREMALVLFTGVVTAGDPRSKAAINIFAFCSSVGSPKIHRATMNSMIDSTYLTSNPIFCLYFTFALAIYSASFFCKTPIS